MNKWMEFENCLKNTEEVFFWWRDDDVKARKPKLINLTCLRYQSRLIKMLKLLEKYNISGIFAVIPDNFFKWGHPLIKILKKHNVYISLHGIYHINNSNDNGVSNEFPDGCNVVELTRIISDYQHQFSEIFGNRLLPVFTPPYNNISAKLEESLLAVGFRCISKRNTINTAHNNYNVDIDITDWQTARMRSEDAILDELIQLINSGVHYIGINGHYNCVRKKGFQFLDKFFKLTTQQKNIKWVMPFENTGIFKHN